MTLQTFIGILVTAVVGFLLWMVQRALTARALAKAESERERRQAIATEHEVLMKRVSDLESKGSEASQTLALLKQDMLPMSEFMKRKLIDVLSHPSPEFKIPDDLLASVIPEGAGLPVELRQILAERAVSKNPHVTEQEKLAAQALPIIVRLAQLEAKEAEEGTALKITQIQLVTSTLPSPQVPCELIAKLLVCYD